MTIHHTSLSVGACNCDNECVRFKKYNFQCLYSYLAVTGDSIGGGLLNGNKLVFIALLVQHRYIIPRCWWRPGYKTTYM